MEAKEDPELLAARFREGLKSAIVIFPEIAKLARMTFDEFIKQKFTEGQALYLTLGILKGYLFTPPAGKEDD